MQIYKITLPNGKIYIGQTCNDNIKLRTGNDLGNYHGNTLFYIDLMIYGPGNAKIETIESNIQSQDVLDKREVYWINYLKSWNHLVGYNIQIGGKNPGSIYKDPYYTSPEYNKLRKNYEELYRKYKDSIRNIPIKVGYNQKRSLIYRGKISKEEFNTWYSVTKQQIINNARNEFIKSISLLK